MLSRMNERQKHSQLLIAKLILLALGVIIIHPLQVDARAVSVHEYYPNNPNNSLPSQNSQNYAPSYQRSGPDGKLYWYNSYTRTYRDHPDGDVYYWEASDGTTYRNKSAGLTTDIQKLTGPNASLYRYDPTYLWTTKYTDTDGNGYFPTKGNWEVYSTSILHSNANSYNNPSYMGIYTPNTSINPYTGVYNPNTGINYNNNTYTPQQTANYNNSSTDINSYSSAYNNQLPSGNHNPNITTDRSEMPPDKDRVRELIKGSTASVAIGSTKAEVLAAQGIPDAQTEYVFNYKNRIFVNFSNARVVSWYISNPEASQANVQNKGYFTLGSTKDEVIAVQGTPDSLTNNTFNYGYSAVYFKDDRVVSWQNSHLKELKAKLIPTSPPQNKDYFTVGASKDEVLAVQGTPDSLTDNTFNYGYSAVYFKDDRVVSWQNSRLKELKVK